MNYCGSVKPILSSTVVITAASWRVGDLTYRYGMKRKVCGSASNTD